VFGGIVDCASSEVAARAAREIRQRTLLHPEKNVSRVVFIEGSVFSSEIPTKLGPLAGDDRKLSTESIPG
jgi:hypothetical protein